MLRLLILLALSISLAGAPAGAPAGAAAGDPSGACAGACAVHLPAGAACASARGDDPSGAFSGAFPGAGCSPWAIPAGAAGLAGPGPMEGPGACGAGAGAGRLYLRRARVMALDGGAGLVTVIDGGGEMWVYCGDCNGLPIGAGVILVMYDNGTTTIYDDAIIAAILTAE